MTFTLQLAADLVSTSSSNVFRVDLDLIWKWLGFTRKEACKDLLINNFVEGLNYSVANIEKDGVSVGRPSHKIYTTIETFKKLAMLTGTKKGNLVREYFLKCENIIMAREPEDSAAVLTEKDAAKLYLISIEDRERLEALLKLQAPKVLIADDFLSCDNSSIELSAFAKTTYSLTGYGPNNLRKKLRDMNILLNGNNQLPRQVYIELGYFKIREVVNFGSISTKIMVTPKGQTFLMKRLRSVAKAKNQVTVAV